jgi:hypothetical protein
VYNAEDLLGLPVAANRPALRHLRRYICLLQEPDAIADDPPLIAHIGTTLADLIALVLGANGDAAQLARSRGLRAARLRAVKADIASNLASMSSASTRSQPARAFHCFSRPKARRSRDSCLASGSPTLIAC